MAAKKPKKGAFAKKQEKIYEDEFYMQSSYGLLIGALGVLWMAQELCWIQTSLPLGPLTIVILGLLIMFARVKKHAG